MMIVISLALLIPCVWQERIQAGDLSSHVYNAWLAGQIQSGAVKGLTVVPQWTNVLSDWALERLLYKLGPVAAERIISGAAVLIFFWGAFLVVDAAAGRKPWLFCPLLGILSYGLIFHLGFLNFYLSTGLCLWILGLLWNPSIKRALASLALALLAFVAHALPVIWVASVLFYLYSVRRIPIRWRIAATLGSVVLLLALQSILTSRYPYRWSLQEVVLGLTGMDQIWLYDLKYLILALAILIVMLALLGERIDQRGLLTEPISQIWILHVVALVLIPSAIHLPQYQHPLAYITERISLFTVLMFIVMVGRARHGRGITRFTGLVTVAFFTCLYLDGLAFNRIERQVDRLAEKLPPGQRLVAAISDSGARINNLLHVADRICVGRCFSFGDYEPATAQFRIRIAGSNKVVGKDMTLVQEIEGGTHVVAASEDPLYAVCWTDGYPGHFYLREIHKDEQMCRFDKPISIRLGLEDWLNSVSKAPAN